MSDFWKIVKELAAFEAMGLAPLDALLRLRDRHNGNRNLSHMVTGTLVHTGGHPLRGLEVELWDRDIGAQNDYLGTATTDAEGRFRILYDPADAGALDRCDFELRVYEPPQRFVQAGLPRVRRVLAERVRGPDDVRAVEYDFGTVELAFYEYDGQVGFPYTSADSLRRDFVPGAAERFYASLARWGAVHDALVLRMRLGESLDTDAIQAHYPKTLTLLEEERSPGRTRGDAWFGKRMLDGFYPALFKKAPGDPESLWMSFDWARFEYNGELELPDFRCRFRRVGAGIEPVEIALRFRTRDEAGACRLGPERHFLAPPLGGAEEEWAQAKRVVRTVYFGVVGQLHGHVALAHFNMEQYAIALNRNLRDNPLRDLLLPHMKEVSNINDKGRRLLLGAEDGLFARAKPITLRSQLEWLQSNLGRCDWDGFHPRAPVCQGHVYARAANVYWEVLGEYLQGWFQRNGDAVRDRWHEVIAFEKDLLEHAVPWVQRGMEEANDDLVWVDDGELARASARRVTRAGVVRAVSPFADGGPPTDEAMARLEQLCRYCIYFCTFVHGWYHREQNNEFGEIRYASMLRGGGMGREDDPALLPSAELQSLGLRVSHSLTGFDWGHLLANEDGDVPAELAAALLARKPEFDAIGFDIAHLRSRLNS